MTHQFMLWRQGSLAVDRAEEAEKGRSFATDCTDDTDDGRPAARWQAGSSRILRGAGSADSR